MITPDFSAYAVNAELRSDRPMQAAELEAAVEGLLSHIAQACGAAGAVLIGHIKCVLETPQQGFLASSVLEPQGKPMSRGELRDGMTEAEVLINVLLYGLTREQVRGIVNPLAERELSLPGVRVKIRDLEEPGNLVHFHEHGSESDHYHPGY